MFGTHHLLHYGIDFDNGLRHLDDELALYLRFLRQFPEDDSIGQLVSAFASGDISQAFAYAHALKGLSGQLGLFRLSERANVLCDLLRKPKTASLRLARAQLSCVMRAYRQALRGIKLL